MLLGLRMCAAWLEGDQCSPLMRREETIRERQNGGGGKGKWLSLLCLIACAFFHAADSAWEENGSVRIFPRDLLGRWFKAGPLLSPDYSADAFLDWSAAIPRPLGFSAYLGPPEFSLTLYETLWFHGLAFWPPLHRSASYRPSSSISSFFLDHKESEASDWAYFYYCCFWPVTALNKSGLSWDYGVSVCIMLCPPSTAPHNGNIFH